MTTILEATGISKRFVLHKDRSVKERIVNFSRSRAYREDFWALRDVDLQVSSGTTIGLVGHNGSGKSTLLKIVGGILQPSSGVVRARGRLAALLELGAGFHPDLTGRENVYLNGSILGLSRSETARYFDEIVEFSGIGGFIDTQVKFYSSGMYVRLAFSVAVHVNPDLLLVDEVLAVGDEPFQRKCMDKIAQFQAEGRTIVLVSHSADQIQRLCSRVAVLDHGSLVFDGGPDEGLAVLRDSFKRQQEGATDEDVRTGTRVQNILVDADQHAIDGSIARNADVRVVVTHIVEEGAAPWLSVVTLENAVGQQVYRISTQRLGLTMPTEPGTYRVEFSLPHNTLGGGRYMARASMMKPGGDLVDSYIATAPFGVEADTRGAGLIQFEAGAEVSREG